MNRLHELLLTDYREEMDSHLSEIRYAARLLANACRSRSRQRRTVWTARLLQVAWYTGGCAGLWLVIGIRWEEVVAPGPDLELCDAALRFCAVHMGHSPDCPEYKAALKKLRLKAAQPVR